MKFGLQLGYWGVQLLQNYVEFVVVVEDVGFDMVFIVEVWGFDVYMLLVWWGLLM